MGDEHHGDGGHGDEHARPHAPRFAINATLIAITAGAVASIFLRGWAKGMVDGSSAAHAGHHAEGGFLDSPHSWMPWLASAVTLAGITVAWWFHLANRKAADALKARLLASRATRWLPTAMENKWYVDELYDWLLRKPLWWIGGQTLNLFDRYVVDMLVIDGVARLPRWLGRSFQPLQNGVLQSYAVSMAGGVGLVALLVLYMPDLIALVRTWLNGGGPGG
jgi:NADH-quinone oxidoreductase subunit L